MKNIPKQYYIFGAVIVILLGVVGYIFMGNGNTATSDDKKSVFEQSGEVIPTVDSSVQATIEGNKDAVIHVSGVPNGTKEIEYELSYNTATGSIEGVFGKIDPKGKSSVDEDIIFGTSSSGVNRYHVIKGDVKGTFKFSGSYGQRILEKNFDVNATAK